MTRIEQAATPLAAPKDRGLLCLVSVVSSAGRCVSLRFAPTCSLAFDPNLFVRQCLWLHAGTYLHFSVSGLKDSKCVAPGALWNLSQDEQIKAEVSAAGGLSVQAMNEVRRHGNK